MLLKYFKNIFSFLLAIQVLTACVPIRSVVYNVPKIKTNHIFPQAKVQPDSVPFYFNEKIDRGFGKRYKIANVYNLFEQTDFETALKKEKTRAFILLHKDTILYEKYFKGYEKEDYFTSFSMTKSLVSSLIGIALKEEKIKSIQDPFCNYLPEVDCDKFGSVTIEHLLQHTSGLDYKGLVKLYYGKNLAKNVLPKGINYPAGTKFKYDNANSQILGILIEKVYQQAIYKVWEDKVWSKIGTEYPIHWAMDDKKHQQAKTFCCVDAVARDFARLGRVWMNDGYYNGNEIIPKSWLDSIQTPTIKDGAAINYKYHFWKTPSEYHCFLAAGMYGQIVLMCPEKDLILVRLGEKNKIQMDDKFWIPVFLQLIDQMEVDGYFDEITPK
ncbi:MAG TPA: serine hydrolase [Chitinophagales bacterium]|nr:serine hydrolase [Chitinophagales bacterium]